MAEHCVLGQRHLGHAVAEIGCGAVADMAFQNAGMAVAPGDDQQPRLEQRRRFRRRAERDHVDGPFGNRAVVQANVDPVREMRRVERGERHAPDVEHPVQPRLERRRLPLQQVGDAGDLDAVRQIAQRRQVGPEAAVDEDGAMRVDRERGADGKRPRARRVHGRNRRESHASEPVEVGVTPGLGLDRRQPARAIAVERLATPGGEPVEPAAGQGGGERVVAFREGQGFGCHGRAAPGQAAAGPVKRA